MTPKQLVGQFFDVVRSGRHPERAREFLAPVVMAHQVQAESALTVRRTPHDYVEHVRAMRAAFGEFSLHVDELLADGDRVYVRWTQRGRHLGELDGVAPTGRPVTEVSSAVYRVEDGKIHEYWIQIDRLGLQEQLRSAGADDVPTAP